MIPGPSAVRASAERVGQPIHGPIPLALRTGEGGRWTEPSREDFVRTPTRRRLAVGVALLITGAIAACGDDDGSILLPGASTTDAAATTIPGAATTQAPTPTTQAETPATTQAPTTTTPPPTTTTTHAPVVTTTNPPSTLELKWWEPAYYDEFDLTSGFSPDPMSFAGVQAGCVNCPDPVDVSYLGGSCIGYANDVPDYEVSYSDGGYSADVLRFYFVPDNPGEDTVLIVNGPDAEWYCGDDSYGTVDPTVTFTAPTYGTYDIFIGTYDPLVLVYGTLFITELDQNHP